MSFLDTFKAARRKGVPFIALRTSDPTATIAGLTAALAATNDPPAWITWDIARGIQWTMPADDPRVNLSGMAAAINTFLGERVLPETIEEMQDVQNELELATGNLPEVLSKARRLPGNTILYLLNYQMFQGKPDVLQASINLRDLFKSDKRILAPVTTFGFTPDTVLRDAMIVLDDPLPDRPQLATILNECIDATEKASGLMVHHTPEIESKVQDAVAGLAAFSAEQAISMSFFRNDVNIVEIDMEGLWNRKRQMVSQTPGLSIYSGKETFDNLGGLSNIKSFFRAYIKGKRPPKAILFTDEIEKQMGGADGDLSGIQQMQLGKLLTWSQQKVTERNPDSDEMETYPTVAGALCIGHPGAGKSAIAKALANEAGVPCIVCDLGDTKNSLVGSSEERIAAALNVVDAVGQGSILWVATCNGMEKMKPEFLSRFQLGQFFFDLPDADEREAIWQVYLKKYKLDSTQPRPNDEGWVGREIEAACYKAWMLNLTLVQAGQYVVVGSVANSERVNALRQSATGKYLSATYDGYYRIGRESRTRPAFTEPGKTRSITV